MWERELVVEIIIGNASVDFIWDFKSIILMKNFYYLIRTVL